MHDIAIQIRLREPARERAVCGVAITFAGRTMPVSVWERELGVRKDSIGRRIRRGWSVERAFTAINQEINP